LYYFLTKL